MILTHKQNVIRKVTKKQAKAISKIATVKVQPVKNVLSLFLQIKIITKFFLFTNVFKYVALFNYCEHYNVIIGKLTMLQLSL